MTFLNPLLLMGLAAAAIPLIIHLFNFRRPKRVEFSSLAFLHELKKSTMQRVRIKQWLLLALRTLAIALLVMAFARPTLTGSLIGSLGGTGKTSTAIVFDNSESMLLRDGSGSYLEQARTIAATLVEEMQPGDELFVVPTISAAVTTKAAAYQNQSSAMQEILSLDAMSGETFLSRSILEANRLLEDAANPNREIYVISDQQASTLVDSSQASVEVPLSTHLIHVGDRNHDNIAVTDVRVLSRILSVGEVVQMEATLVNFGDSQADDVVVSLYLEGERVARATTQLAPGETTRIPIAATPRLSGWLGGQVEIEDSDYRGDDSRQFTIFIPEERRILVVGGLEATTSFIELALSEEVTERRVRFDVERIAEADLARAILGAYDTIVLSGITDLSSGERSALLEYVAGGGGLLIFPGDGMVLPEYNDLLSRLGGGVIESLTDPLADSFSVAGFDQVDTEHALFEGMFEVRETGAAPQLEQPEIYRMILYRPGDGSEQTLIRLSGDRSFLQEIRHERGSVILFAVAPEEAWSDLPLRGLFVPVLYRSIYYLSAGGSVTGDMFTAGSSAQVRLTGISSSATVTILAENGDSYIPELRHTPGSVLALVGPGFLVPGIYRVVVDGADFSRFVVHTVSNESDLRTLEPDQAIADLEDVLGYPINAMNLSGEDRDAVRAQISAVRTGVELWNVFLMLALVTLLAEMVVEKKWRPEAA